MLSFLFEVLFDRFADHLSDQATDEDRINGAYKGAWTISKTSGHSEHLLVEQLERYNVPRVYAADTTVVGRSVRQWFHEGVSPRRVKRRVEQLLPTVDRAQHSSDSD